MLRTATIPSELRTALIAPLFCSLTVAATTLPASALVLGSYTFDGNVLTPTPGIDPNVSFSNFSPVGITPNASGTTLGFSAGSPGRAINYENWSPGFDVDKYYEFTVTPNNGYPMSFTSLSLEARPSDTGPKTVEVRSSVDGFAIALSTLTLPPIAFTSSTTTFGAPFQNLTSPVTFRIYGYNAELPVGTLRLDNVVLNGPTQIEPVPFQFAIAWGIVPSALGFGMRKFRDHLKATSDR